MPHVRIVYLFLFSLSLSQLFASVAPILLLQTRPDVTDEEESEADDISGKVSVLQTLISTHKFPLLLCVIFRFAVPENIGTGNIYNQILPLSTVGNVSLPVRRICMLGLLVLSICEICLERSQLFSEFCVRQLVEIPESVTENNGLEMS